MFGQQHTNASSATPLLCQAFARNTESRGGCPKTIQKPIRVADKPSSIQIFDRFASCITLFASSFSLNIITEK